MADSLVANKVTARRGGRLVFRDLELVVHPGEAVILRGPNGAGKSTLLRLLSGLLRPESGTISRAGVAIADDPEGHHAGLHYIGHSLALKGILTAAENLAFWAEARGGTTAEVLAALHKAGATPFANLEVRRLSAGQQRRVSLARLFVSPASLWLLDEPTVTLDRAAVAALARNMADHLASGGMIVAATHVELGLDGARVFEMAASPYDEAAA